MHKKYYPVSNGPHHYPPVEIVQNDWEKHGIVHRTVGRGWTKQYKTTGKKDFPIKTVLFRRSQKILSTTCVITVDIIYRQPKNAGIANAMNRQTHLYRKKGYRTAS